MVENEQPTGEQKRAERMTYCQNCGTQLSEGAKFCPECGQEQSKPTASVQPAQPQQKPAKPKTKGKHLLIIVVAVVGMLIFVSLICSRCGGGSSSSKRDEGDKYGAYVVCQKFVKERLVAPATAKFPAAGDMDIGEVDPAAKAWQVVGYVDSENKLGAMLRLDFVCEVTYQGNDKWNLQRLDLNER